MPRGRKPSAVSSKEFKEIIRAICRLEARHKSYCRSMERRNAALVAEIAQLKGKQSRTIRGRGPNVRDVAYEFLRKRGDQPIQKIAAAVRKSKGGRPGANFVQNLGAALQRDERFKRVSRGVYGLRSSSRKK